MDGFEPSKLAPAAVDPIAGSALRKVTWRLIPLIALGYGVAYMGPTPRTAALVALLLDTPRIIELR